MSESNEMVVRERAHDAGARGRSIAGMAKKAGIIAVAAGLVGGVALPAVAFSGDVNQSEELRSLYAASNQGGEAVEGHTVDFTPDQIIATTQAELDEYLAEQERIAAAERAEAAAEAEAAATAQSGNGPANPRHEAPSGVSGGNEAVVQAALAQLGVNQDCFSMMRRATAAAGYNINSYNAVWALQQVSMADAKPGDILYYSNGGRGLPHVAIYLGNGNAVHGGWYGSDTVVASAYVGSGPIAYALP